MSMTSRSSKSGWKGSYNNTTKGRIAAGKVPELESFISACHYGSLAKAESIIHSHDEIPVTSYINGTSSGKETALHKAAGAGHSGIVKFLLGLGSNADAKNAVMNKNSAGLTPLHRAAGKGHLEIVRMLLDADADPDVGDEGRHTPVEYAKCMGHRDVEDLLVDRGGTPVSTCTGAFKNTVVRHMRGMSGGSRTRRNRSSRHNDNNGGNGHHGNHGHGNQSRRNNHHGHHGKHGHHGHHGHNGHHGKHGNHGKHGHNGNQNRRNRHTRR